MREALTFDDVLIVPRFSDIDSRRDVSLHSRIRDLTLNELPVISANMQSVTGSAMSKAMLSYGAQACLPRFMSVADNVQLFENSKIGNLVPMVSIGIGPSELERAEALYQAGGHTIVLDVANGAQMSVVKQVKAIRQLLGPTVNIVVGNFASAVTVKQFIEYTGKDVNAIKVGIGPGSSCTTRVVTGCGYPQFTAVSDIASLLKHMDVTVIADGGMKRSGDVAKALGAGAHMVMTGGMLSGTHETSSEMVIGEDGKTYMTYSGSASHKSYIEQGKEAKHRSPEGESFLVPYKGLIHDVLQEIEGGLRSALTYTGSRNLKEFHDNVEFVRVTQAGVQEGKAHGKTN